LEKDIVTGSTVFEINIISSVKNKFHNAFPLSLKHSTRCKTADANNKRAVNPEKIFENVV